MKGNKKLLVVAVLLLLIAVSYGTYAIYRESVTATGLMTAAAWSVTIDGDSFDQADLEFDLTDLTCTTNPGKAGTIAPGAECYIDYAIDADGSQVDVVVEVDDENSTIPDGFEVTVGSGSLTIPYSSTEGGMEATARLNVTWPGALTDDATKDGNDLALKGTNLSFSIKLVARQALN